METLFPKIAALVFVLVFVIDSVRSTVSYDLEVPGKQPIRIIEADPLWGQDEDYREKSARPITHRGDRDDRFDRHELEHRTLRPNKIIISERHDVADDNEDNSANLKKFLNSFGNGEVPPPPKDEFYLKDKFASNGELNIRKPENSKSWNLLHFDKLPHANNQQQGNKGWVSMDAVPWSVSKISKWHERPKKDKYQSPPGNFYDRPLNNDRYQNNNDNDYDLPRPTFNTKPIRPVRPSSYYDDVDEDIGDDDPDDNYYNKRPSFPRPSAVYGHKVNVQTYGTTNKRPHKHDGSNCKHDGEIITDGQAPNFPDHEYGNRRRGAASETVSVTHPYKTDGEWVLLSTTKGYKHPKNRQRSIQFQDSSPSNAIDTRKSVKLTVLPPLKNSRVNMTTSHGGLLQVESTFQTVDEAQKAFVKRQRIKTKIRKQGQPAKLTNQSNKLQITNGALTQQQLQQLQQQYKLQFGTANKDLVGDSSDTASVLAAVGAGMIPASMALLVPMAMSHGRRRRDLRQYKRAARLPKHL